MLLCLCGQAPGAAAVWFGLALAPCILLFALFYAGYTHFGVTVLAKNFIGNNLTLESFVYGMVLGTTAASVLLWLSCHERDFHQRQGGLSPLAGFRRAFRFFSPFACGWFPGWGNGHGRPAPPSGASGGG